MHPSAQKVTDAARELGLDVEIMAFAQTTRTDQEATAATTRVLIDSVQGRRTWSTVGASANIIEASWQALVDSMEYALLK